MSTNTDNKRFSKLPVEVQPTVIPVIPVVIIPASVGVINRTVPVTD